MTMHDEFSGIFDNLDPQQFIFTGTSVLDEVCETGPFLQFVYTQRLMVRAQYAAAEGNPNFMFILATDTRICGFVPQDGEDMDGFVARMTREAQAMGATRLFFTRKTKISARPIPETTGCAPMDTLAAEAPDQGLHDGVIWYAEDRTGDEIVRLSGTYELGSDERLIDTNYYSDQRITVLDTILGS